MRTHVAAAVALLLAGAARAVTPDNVSSRLMIHVSLEIRPDIILQRYGIVHSWCMNARAHIHIDSVAALLQGTRA
jgi:hypothetical protein